MTADTITLTVPDTAEGITDNIMCESRYSWRQHCGHPAAWVIEIQCQCARRARYACDDCMTNTKAGYMRCGRTWAHRVTMLNAWSI